MANRIMLNETSYHGSGAIAEIAAEAAELADYISATKRAFGLRVRVYRTVISDKRKGLSNYLTVIRRVGERFHI